MTELAHLMLNQGERLDQRGNWHTNRCHAIDDMYDAMAKLDGRPGVSYAHLRGIRGLINQAIHEAGRHAFAHRFQGFKYLERDAGGNQRGVFIPGDHSMFVWEGQYPKDGEVHLKVTADVNYGGLTDILSDAGNAVAIFQLFINYVRDMVRERYPSCVVSMSHNGHHKYKGQKSVTYYVSVVCRGRMP